LQVRIVQVDPHGVNGLELEIDAIGYHLGRGVVDAFKNGHPRIRDDQSVGGRHGEEEHDGEE
jgi:hypothetical protein